MNTSVTEVPAFIAPLRVPVKLLGRELVLQRANVGQILQLLAVAGPVARLVMAFPPDMLDRVHSEEGPSREDVLDLFEALSQQPQALARAVAIAADLTEPEVAGLGPDEFAYLFALVVQVNADFFFRATSVFNAAGRVLRQIQGSSAASGNAPSGS